MAQNKIIDVIKANKLFENISPDDLLISLNQKDVISFKEGDIIFQAGDTADQIFLLTDGEVKIKYSAPIDGQRIFEKITGDFFGEKEFMEAISRRSSAVANKPSSVYVLQRKEINTLISKHRTILNTIQRLDPSRSDFSDYHTSKEIYPDELNRILKTADTSVGPYEYTNRNTTQDFPLSGETERKLEPIIPEPSDGENIDNFPKRFNATFEDSFNFSDFQNLQAAEAENNTNITAEPEDISKMGWNFSEPEENPILAEDEKYHINLPEFSENEQGENIELEDAQKTSVDSFSLDWSFPELQNESTKQGTLEDFSSHSEITEPEPAASDIQLDLLYTGNEEVIEAKETEGEEPAESYSWDFSSPEEDDKLTEQVSIVEQPASVTPEESESGIPWSGDDLTGDQPIREFEFDEFGNLIPLRDSEPATVDEVLEMQKLSALESEIDSASMPAEDIPTRDESTELNEDKFIFNDTPESEVVSFGDNRFVFTRSLESNPEIRMPDNDMGTVHDLDIEQLKLIIEAAQIVNSNIKIDEVLNTIVQAASLLTQADRGTLYIVDNSTNELWSKVIRGEDIEEIRLQVGQGLAGWVAKTGEIINLADVPNDKRFAPHFDRQSGYKTKTMLCFPIKNKAGIIIAVIQLLNSQRGVFTSLDETFLSVFSAHIAIALENAELVEQLLKTDRLTSLGKVAKFLISDIKKPILTIKHLAEHIRKKNVSADVNQVIQMMIEQSNIVVDLVLTTLSFSEGKAVLNKKVLSSHRMLSELLDLLAEYVEYRKTKLFKKLGPDLLINVDRREMYQAFFQIAKNACDAMPQGGELYVTAYLSEDDKKLVISFKDKGVGIPESIIERVLEPFMSHGKPNGVGLGLAITEKVVKEQDGNIRIESELGEGTTVTIELPLVKEF